MEALQDYWWVVISLLGAILVFLLFVQGGQTMLKTDDLTELDLKTDALGRKWELTYTTLVVFGGAFFASFPLFYSTSFGGAYWLWMIILFSFILQAVSYEFRTRPGNIFGRRVYDIFLFINGSVGCVLLGVAVGTMMFGAHFIVNKGSILNDFAPVISRWDEYHGLAEICNWRNLLLGFTVLFLARMNASLYFINSIDYEKEFYEEQRHSALINGGIFVVLFLAFVAVLLTSTGFHYTDANIIAPVRYKYFYNLIDMWWCGVLFIVGVLMVLYGLGATVFKAGYRRGFWWAGAGTVIVVLVLFLILGLNHTAYLPSLADYRCSLTIRNSSSSYFTLKVMAWVSVLTPIVIGYIAVVWRKLTPIEAD